MICYIKSDDRFFLIKEKKNLMIGSIRSYVNIIQNFYYFIDYNNRVTLYINFFIFQSKKKKIHVYYYIVSYVKLNNNSMMGSKKYN